MQVPFICPVCGAVLASAPHSYLCPKGHCFDIAKSGYVNLLQNSSKGHHGDDKLMVQARKTLFDKGYYSPLADKAAQILAEELPTEATLLDAGCGEGTYTERILSSVQACSKNVDIIGIDISKDAVAYAAKRSRAFRLAVASSSALPVPDASLDCVVNIFSPLISAEFLRVLKPGGLLLRIIPLERHLWELKELIYDTPYENDVPDPQLEGFKLAGSWDVLYRIQLPSNEDIMNLFRMTPYYYKTGKNDQEKAMAANELDVRLQFRILLYHKL